jgi:hypothetical protein
MSNRNNDVFQVLVTSENKGLLAAGNSVENLLVGQLGAFDAKTNISVGAATSPMPREIYLAVGTDKDGTGVMTDIRTSAGQNIQRQGITAFSFKGHTVGAPMIVNVGGYKPSCDTDYGIRVEFRNSRIARIQGTNQFSKSYVVKTPCCDDCAGTCDTIDANILTRLFIEEIGKDVAGLLITNYVARQNITMDTHGVSVDYAAGDNVIPSDVDILVEFNKTAADADKAYTDLSLTSVPLKIGAFSQINLSYHKLLETVLVVSLVEGFNCSGSTVTSQYPRFAEGTGTNIMQKEYHASGWAGSGPYKLSEVLGMSKGDIDYLAKKNVPYDQFILEYANKSESGWLEYENTLTTIIATPEADTTTRASVAAFLDAVTASLGFEPLADDAAAANHQPGTSEPLIVNVNKDGLA